MSSYPYWLAQAQLTSQADGYSFDSHPEVLNFGESANLPVSVTLLNGSLPPGMSWTVSTTAVQLVGQLNGILEDTDYAFTFRLSNGKQIADQTFFITVTSQVTLLQWTTLENRSLGYYISGRQTFSVSASTQPYKPISYQWSTAASTGISIDKGTGEISVDLTWKPLTSYRKNLDYVINNNHLYACTVSGNSSVAHGPSTIGSNLVDSDYAPWTQSTRYIVGDHVTNDTGKVFVCTRAGTSGGSGPTGGGSVISDGSAVWTFQSQAPVWNRADPGVVALHLNITAKTDTSTIPGAFDLDLVSRPCSPIWTTPAGSLGTVTANEWFTYELQVLNPNLEVTNFSSTALPGWLTLTVLGELWGHAPSSNVDSVLSFSITVANASTPLQTVQRDFSITVLADVQDLSWTSSSDLGTFPDGQPCWLQIQAETLRAGNALAYSFTGGMLPPNTVVLSQTGLLSGFVEYHPIDKKYEFEISVTDGVDTITQRFELTVQSQNQGRFLGLSIPIMGRDKLDFISNNNNSIIEYSYLFDPNDVNYGHNTHPRIQITNGIKWDDPTYVRSIIANWLHEFTVVGDYIDFSADASLPYQTVFLTLQDSNSLQLWKPYTAYSVNTRVTNGTGDEFVSTIGGTSGAWPGPIGGRALQPDGSVVWRLEEGQNLEVSRSSPLPWYPKHTYTAQQTAVNDGTTYQISAPGVSSGGFGPTGQGQVQDSTARWTSFSGVVAALNQFYPPSIRNIRKVLSSALGYSSSVGTGATAQVELDVSGTGIGSVTVVSHGAGYYLPPLINVVGNGKGAKLSASLSIQAVSVVKSGPGFTVGTSFVVDHGIGKPGKISISSVDAIGRVLTIAVDLRGSFVKFPTGDITFFANGRRFSARVDLGIKSVSVVNPGSGYDIKTVVNFDGGEILPGWQEMHTMGYVPSIELARMTIDGSRALTASNGYNPFLGQVIEVKQVELQIQGIDWAGTTSFDHASMTFDGGATRVVEVVSATDTIFDKTKTRFDSFQTVFDTISNSDQVLESELGSQSTLQSQLYQALADYRSQLSESENSHTWLLFFGKPFQ